MKNIIYMASESGNVLTRKSSMFYWRGIWFHGLVDEKNNALYDDPDDSFADHVGIETSISKGLIELC